MRPRGVQSAHMAGMPAFCDSCGNIFPSGIGIGSARNLSFANVKSQCPKCGAMGHIPDGVYDFVDNTLKILSASERSNQELRRFAELLRAAQEAPDKAAELEKTIAAELPALAALAAELLSEAKKQTRISYITLVLNAVLVVLAAKDSGRPIQQATPEQVFNQTFVTVQQQPAGDMPKAPVHAKAKKKRR
jgi:hypothetical protein